MKNGEAPHPGPLPVEGEDELQDVAGAVPGPSGSFGWNTNPDPVQPQQPQAPYQPPANIYQPPAPTDSSTDGLPFHLPDPPKDPEPKNPGGFIPFNPSTSDFPVFSTGGTGARTPEQIGKAQKYCKFVVSALNYDDVPTAIVNLQKCLRLLQTGEDS